jgi:hypothetical protein
MIRAMSFLLSFWLALLFIAGQLANAPQLLIDAIGFAALWALLGAIVMPMMGPKLRLACAIIVTAWLSAICLIAWLHKTPEWIPWTVAMGTFCFIGVTIAELIWAPRNRGTMAPADS